MLILLSYFFAPRDGIWVVSGRRPSERFASPRDGIWVVSGRRPSGWQLFVKFSSPPERLFGPHGRSQALLPAVALFF